MIYIEAVVFLHRRQLHIPLSLRQGNNENCLLHYINFFFPSEVSYEQKRSSQSGLNSPLKLLLKTA